MQRLRLMGSGGPSSKGATGQWNESLPICPNIDIVDTLMRNSKADFFRDFGHALAMLHFKNENAFPGRAPPQKASESVLRRRLYRKWARTYACPGSNFAPSAASFSLPSSLVYPCDNSRGRWDVRYLSLKYTTRQTKRAMTVVSYGYDLCS